MKIAQLVKLAFLFLATVTITGCLLVPMDDGGYRGNNQDRSRGEHRGEHHDDNDRR
jgi:hypothetical protein